MKTSEEDIMKSHAESAQAGPMASEADISLSSSQQQNPPSPSSPQTTISPKKKKKKKKSKKKNRQSSIPDSSIPDSSSATQLVSSVPSEDPDSQSVHPEAAVSNTSEAKPPLSTPTHKQTSPSGGIDSSHDNSIPLSDPLSKVFEGTAKKSSLTPTISPKHSPKDSPRDMSYKEMPARASSPHQLLAPIKSLNIKTYNNHGDESYAFVPSATIKEMSSDGTTPGSSGTPPDLASIHKGK